MQTSRPLRVLVIGIAALCLVAAAAPSPAPSEGTPEWAKALLAAYPDHLAAIEDNTLVWRDGTRMALDDGKGRKPHAQWLEAPDIEDMFAQPYPAGAAVTDPPAEFDPGRARNAAFFDKMYGNCHGGEVEPHLVEIDWLPGRPSQSLKMTRINGVADKLAAVGRELAALPPELEVFLLPAAGGYNCRVIAGTSRTSAHGHGIAVDIALAQADYWRWAGSEGAAPRYRNRIPAAIVAVFEKHGFIWGGRWHHYDTMHFEYRPELLAVPARLAPAPARN